MQEREIVYMIVFVCIIWMYQCKGTREYFDASSLSDSVSNLILTDTVKNQHLFQANALRVYPIDNLKSEIQFNINNKRNSFIPSTTNTNKVKVTETAQRVIETRLNAKKVELENSISAKIDSMVTESIGQLDTTLSKYLKKGAKYKLKSMDVNGQTGWLNNKSCDNKSGQEDPMRWCEPRNVRAENNMQYTAIEVVDKKTFNSTHHHPTLPTPTKPKPKPHRFIPRPAMPHH